MVNTEGDLADLRRRVTALEDRMDVEAGLRATQEAELAALGIVQRGMLRTMQAVRETQVDQSVVLSDHTRRLDGVDGRLDAIDIRLDSLDTRVDGLDLKLDSLDAKVDNLDGRVDDLGRKVDEIGDDVGEVKVSVERILELLVPG